MPAPLPPPPPLSHPQTNRRAVWFGVIVGLLVLIIGGTGLVVYQAVSSVAGSSSQNGSTINEQTLRGSSINKIAVIKIHGEIVTDTSTDPSTVSAATIKEMIQKAHDDSRVRAVVLDIDSPGGSVVAASQIYDALRSLHKPIVALYSGELAASGGLYVSMAADKIVSYPETLTGSIGVIAQFVDVSQLMQKYGVSVNTIKSGQYKDIGSYSRPMTDAERTMLQGLINESYNRFVEIIASSRHMSTEKVKTFADGRIYSGRDAKVLGMVDELGDMTTAESLAKGLANIQDDQLVEYTTTSPISLRSLLGAVSQIHTSDAQAILGILSQNRSKPSMELYYLAN